MGMQLGIERAAGIVGHDGGNHVAGGPVGVGAGAPHAGGGHRLDFPEGFGHRLAPPVSDALVSAHQIEQRNILGR